MARRRGGTQGRSARAFALEPHGDRRRRQLLEVAAHLVESEGPDAVRMPRVAELAGCARTLVYRYFPQREDLLAGIAADFYARLNARIGAEEHALGIAALADPDTERAWSRSRAVLEATWDAVDDLGPGGLVLARSALAAPKARGRQRSGTGRELERRWFGPLREQGLSEPACAVALEAAIALTHALLMQHRAGALARDQAIALGFRALHSLIDGLRRASGAV
jgi:AcrR family transcriptional regulator